MKECQQTIGKHHVQRKVLVMLAILLCLLPFRGEAQFMRLEITVDAEFNIVRQRDPDTAPVAPGSGWIGLSENEAGHLDIQAAENVQLHVTVDAPDELVLDDENSMPFRFYAIYCNQAACSFHDAIPFDGNTAVFPLSGSGLLVEDMDSALLQSSIFLTYAFYAGNVSPGQYRGEITVAVEYL